MSINDKTISKTLANKSGIVKLILIVLLKGKNENNRILHTLKVD